jgi:hypothetical protein
MYHIANLVAAAAAADLLAALLRLLPAPAGALLVRCCGLLLCMRSSWRQLSKETPPLQASVLQWLLM